MKKKQTQQTKYGIKSSDWIWLGIVGVVFIFALMSGYSLGTIHGEGRSCHDAFACVINWTTANDLNNITNINSLAICTIGKPAVR